MTKTSVKLLYVLYGKRDFGLLTSLIKSRSRHFYRMRPTIKILTTATPGPLTGEVIISVDFSSNILSSADPILNFNLEILVEHRR